MSGEKKQRINLTSTKGGRGQRQETKKGEWKTPLRTQDPRREKRLFGGERTLRCALKKFTKHLCFAGDTCDLRREKTCRSRRGKNATGNQGKGRGRKPRTVSETPQVGGACLKKRPLARKASKSRRRLTTTRETFLLPRQRHGCTKTKY